MKRTKKSNGHRAPRDERAPAWVDPFDSDNALDGLPALLDAPPTTLIVVHGTFTAQHVIGELRYHFQIGNLQPGDLQQLAQLGKEIQEELEKET